MNILSLNDRAIQNRDIVVKGGKRVRENWEQNSQQVDERMMFGTSWSQIDDDGDFEKPIDIFNLLPSIFNIINWTSVGLSLSLLATGSKAHVFLQRECRRDATLYSPNISHI